MTTHQKSELVRRGYSKIAKKYNKQRNIYKNRALVIKFSKRLQKGAEVLDLGCGAGVPVARYLSNKGFSVTGIDFAKGMLDLARANVPKASFRMMDMAKMKFSDNSFDGAVSFYAMIHIPREKHAGIYKKLHRILKPDGIILVNASGPDAWEGYEKNYLGVKMFWSFYDPKRTTKIIENAGFKILWNDVLKIGGERQFWVLASNRK